MTIKQIAYLGVLTSFALILSYFERMLPPIVPVPGVKLGLSNLTILMAMYLLGNKYGFYTMVVKCTIVAILFGGISSFLYSITGGILSYIFMYIFKKIKIFSICGVSVIGGVGHNLGQIIIATLIVGNIKLLYYFSILIVSGVIAGICIGIVSYMTLNYLKVINN